MIYFHSSLGLQQERDQWLVIFQIGKHLAVLSHSETVYGFGFLAVKSLVLVALD